MANRTRTRGASISNDGMSAVGRRQRMLSFQNHRIADEFIAEQEAADREAGVARRQDAVDDVCIENFLAGGRYLAAMRHKEAQRAEMVRRIASAAIVGILLAVAVVAAYCVSR